MPRAVTDTTRCSARSWRYGSGSLICSGQPRATKRPRASPWPSVRSCCGPGSASNAQAVEAVKPKGALRPLQLLVIDHEVKVADVTRQMLQLHGHVVRVASQPAQALRIWAEHGATTDLVICDVAMAEMRGPELIAALSKLAPRAEEGRPSPPGTLPRVLFITGYSEEAARSELGHPVLAKPFTMATLLSAISDAVGP